jgi:hypothetical protein
VEYNKIGFFYFMIFQRFSRNKKRKEKDKTVPKTAYNRAREVRYTAFKVEEVFCPMLEFREEKWTFTKVEGVM